MRFDKKTGVRRLKTFFGGIANGIGNLKDKYDKYKEEEPERIQKEITRLDSQIALETRKNKLNKLKEVRGKTNANGGNLSENLSQQKIFAPEIFAPKTNKTKKRTSSLDDGYSGIGEGLFGG